MVADQKKKKTEQVIHNKNEIFIVVCYIFFQIAPGADNLKWISINQDLYLPAITVC